VQVVPATQTVGPVHPVPPHWPYFAACGVLPSAVLAGAAAVLAAAEEAASSLAGPDTDVVSEPLSIYTPLK